MRPEPTAVERRRGGGRPAEVASRGHRVSGSTSRLLVEAWGPTLESCVAEAIVAAIGGELTEPSPVTVPVEIETEPGSPAEMASTLIGDVLDLEDVFGLAPTDVLVTRLEDGGLACAIDAADVPRPHGPRGRLATISVWHEPTAPRAWRCRAELDTRPVA